MPRNIEGPYRSSLVSALLLTVCAAPCGAGPLLHPVFQDHAVLQREKPIRVWGWARPSARVEVSLGGATATARADETGRWQAILPPMQAGGPYELVVREEGGAEQSLRDVLIGDVWLCAGQSNMELQVRYTLNAYGEITGGARDSIRMFTIARASSAVPLETYDQPPSWQPASPQTVGDFSATCYYFARELQKTVDVPMGLINASWGGTKIQPWMSAGGLEASGHGSAVALLERYRSDAPGALAAWGEVWKAWWAERAPADVRAPWSPETNEARDWPVAPQGFGAWETWGDPMLEAFDGMMWYRTSFTLTQAQAAQDAVLVLGPADEVDHTWLNGHFVGTMSDYRAERRYDVPAGWLRAGENVLAVNVLDTYGHGGLYGPPEGRALHLADGTRIPLEGPWRYYVIAAPMDAPPSAPWDVRGGASMIYNAMVAPLRGYGLRGAVWYQGESNTPEPGSYERLLSGLMQDWRRQFGEGLPFLVVQLAGFGPPSSAPAESGWAQVREAQRRAVARDPRAGLVVTIDIGDRYDLHPPNKQEVGRRLARAARHIVYGEAIAPSGPIPVEAIRKGGHVVVTFRDVQGRLVTYSSDTAIGFELCGSAVGSCRYVRADVNGSQVALGASEVGAATRVRYCWADSPVCNLYDQSGLPVGPFELAVR